MSARPEELVQKALDTLHIFQVENTVIKTQRDALLAALRRHVELHDGDCICEDCAAIKQAQE